MISNQITNKIEKINISLQVIVLSFSCGYILTRFLKKKGSKMFSQIVDLLLNFLMEFHMFHFCRHFILFTGKSILNFGAEILFVWPASALF
jgi:hypothetical protein